MKRVEQITDGKGAYAAIDAVGGIITHQLLAATRPFGRLLVYGVLSGYTISASINNLLFFDKVRMLRKPAGLSTCLSDLCQLAQIEKREVCLSDLCQLAQIEKREA